MTARFDLQAPFQPAGDQPRAITELTSADGHVTGALAVEVENLAHLQKVLKAARRVKGVTEVTRKERLASDD